MSASWTLSHCQPLNIFSGLVLVPLINLLLQFKNVLAPITVPFLKLVGQLLRMAAPCTRCFRVIWSSMSASLMDFEPLSAFEHFQWTCFDAFDKFIATIQECPCTN